MIEHAPSATPNRLARLLPALLIALLLGPALTGCLSREGEAPEPVVEETSAEDEGMAGAEDGAPAAEEDEEAEASEEPAAKVAKVNDAAVAKEGETEEDAT